MDSTTSPHCIPSPPIFSLDVRNLGHLCFEELPEAATAIEAKAKHFSISQNQHHQKDKTSQSMNGAAPVTFLPIEQNCNEAKYQHPSGGDDDIFDDIFTTLEDVLDEDQPGRKPSVSVLYPTVGLSHAPLADGSTSQHSHSDPYAPIPLDSGSESGSGHTTVDSAQSTSPASHMYEDSQYLSGGYTQNYDNRAANEGSEGSEISSESLESCLQTLHQHHNSHEKGGTADAMDGFISKFGKLKPQTGDSREQILARAALLAQRRSKQPKEQDVRAPPYSDSSGHEHEGREQSINRTDELTNVGAKSVKLPGDSSSEDLKRARTQPMTPALLVSTLPQGQNSTQDSTGSAQQVKCADAMVGVQPSNTTSTNTSTSSRKDYSDIPIAARALPLLPTSLESFRSQLSKSKKNSVAKKKQLPLPAKAATAKAQSSASPGSSAGIAANGKKSTSASKKSAQVPKSKKSKVQNSIPSSADSRSSEYNLSEYFSSDEISGLLSVICSDDECDGDRDGPADVVSRGADHVKLSPHVESGGAFFSFGTGGYGASSSNRTSASCSASVGSSASVMSGPADKSARKRKVEAVSMANPVVKKSTGSPARPTGRSSSASSSSTYVHTPLSAASRKTSSPHSGVSNLNQNYLSMGHASGHANNMMYDTSPRMNVDRGEHLRRAATQHSGRDSYALSLEMQRKIAEDSERVLRMQTDKILQDNHQRQLSQGGGAVDSVPSLLSSLGSVGGSNTHLQGLTGLSSVLQGGGSGIPSLSSMYASAGSSALHTSSPAAGVSPGFIQTAPSPQASLVAQPHAQVVQGGAPSQMYSPPGSVVPSNLLGGMRQHPQQQASYSSPSQMYQTHSSPQQYQYQHQHQHFK